MELQYLQFWPPGENLGPCLPGRMTVLCRQHFLLGDVVLETKSDGLVAAGGDGAMSGGVGAAILGPMVVFLSSAGLHVVSAAWMCLLKTLPVVAVAVW